MLKEYVFIGRGGQGLYTAVELLSKALVLEGYYAHAIPFFGAERRGAMTFSYLRVDTSKIARHDRVRNPNGILIGDSSEEVIEALKSYTPKPNAIVVLNLDRAKIEAIINALPSYGSLSFYGLHANKIALEEGLFVSGWPVIGTAFSGAFSKIFGMPSLAGLISVLGSVFQIASELLERNIKVVKRAYEETRAIRYELQRAR